MNRLLNYPLWLFELLTTAKSFKDNPILGSALLNRLGLHVFRVVLATGVMRFRMWLLSFSVSREDRKAYWQQGYIVKQDFLSEAEFAALAEEARNFRGEIRQARQGDTLTQRAVLTPEVMQQLPTIQRLFSHPEWVRLARFTAGHLRAPLYYIENVKNGFSPGPEDPQKTLHVDTFHPSMKCWFFLDDVDADTGPYTYVPGSHKLDWKRIKWLYRMSIQAKNAENLYHARGSTRFNANDLKELGLPEPHAFAVRKNTLVIANVFGIHRRGDSQKKSTRLAIWGDSRTNPFIPFPGFSGSLANRLQYHFLEQYRRNIDEKAKKEGRLSPWRILDADESHF